MLLVLRWGGVIYSSRFVLGLNHNAHAVGPSRSDSKQAMPVVVLHISYEALHVVGVVLGQVRRSVSFESFQKRLRLCVLVHVLRELRQVFSRCADPNATLWPVAPHLLGHGTI